MHAKAYQLRETPCFMLWVQLDASKNRLEGVLSSISKATRLASDIASLRSIVTSMQASGEDNVNSPSSGGIQEINGRFLNVTEAWQLGLAAVTTDLKTLREESRASHGRVTESVNDADRRLRALTERLEEFEVSTRRNARAFERTEADDVRQTQGQLDWNTARVSELDEKLTRLAHADREHSERLDEHVPRAQQCQEHLPAVEEAVRSILRLATGFASMERRVEELGLQVLGLEDSMLRGLTQTLQIRQAVDALKAGSAGAGGGERQEEQRSAGSEIDAMLETLREMDMEMDMGRKEAGDHMEEEEMESRRGMEEEEEVKEVGSKGVTEEREEVEKETMERVEDGEKADKGAVTDSIPSEEPEDKLGDLMDNPGPVAAELPESSIAEESQAPGGEEDIPESHYSDVNV